LYGAYEMNIQQLIEEIERLLKEKETFKDSDAYILIEGKLIKIKEAGTVYLKDDLDKPHLLIK
jgi:hypothetical protein